MVAQKRGNICLIIGVGMSRQDFWGDEERLIR